MDAFCIHASLLDQLIPLPIDYIMNESSTGEVAIEGKFLKNASPLGSDTIVHKKAVAVSVLPKK